jgi:AcrR family transcriptional regulator
VAGERRRRKPLTREAVLQAGVELADADGLDALSMRHLGGKLGVEAMSLYNHVGGKDDLLDGMVDLVVAEIAVPAEGADWRTAMRERAVSARGVLNAHPWAIGLLESRANPGPGRLGYYDKVLARLRSAGFSVEMAMHAFASLDSFVYGFALQASTLRFQDVAELDEVGAELLEKMAGEYPHLAEATRSAMASGYEFEDEFLFGVDLILDGLERMLAGG